MIVIYLLPAILSALLMAAHFLRAGHLGLVLLCLAAPLLLLVPRRWAGVLIQVLLVLAAAEWLRTMAAIIVERQQRGEPFRAVIYILGSVALWNVVAALIFFLPAPRRRYGRRPPQS
jgi:hypothetical protein